MNMVLGPQPSPHSGSPLVSARPEHQPKVSDGLCCATLSELGDWSFLTF